MLLYPLGFGVAVAGLPYAAVRLGEPAYMTAITSTTTNRAQGAVPNGTILPEAAEWGGVLFVGRRHRQRGLRVAGPYRTGREDRAAG